jgi:hypothetical protein
MDERFIAVFPSLVRLLGSLEAAVILQHMHFCADEEGTITISMPQISEDTGISLRTIERKVGWLREEGYVTAERTARFDATLTYRIDHAKVASSIPPNAGLDPAKVAGSEPAKVAGSSTKKERTTTSAGTTEVVTPREQPDTHPSRPIETDWMPSRPFIAHLRREYPRVDLRESCNRFVMHHISRKDTSRSWEAQFAVWVSQDAERMKDREGGTDEFGNPRNQRKTSTVRDLQPGDPGYVDWSTQ